jgi:hypothetical protein
MTAMKTLLVGALAVAAILLAHAANAAVSVAYSDPTGGWTYAFLGTTRTISTTDVFDGLDGTWVSKRLATNQSSTLYDGSDLGGTFAAGNAPGGAALGTEGTTNFLRMQDPGDPRDAPLSLADPNNRKVYFGHNIANDAGVTSAATIGNAVTLSFRARLSTTGVIDAMYPDNLMSATVPGENNALPQGTPWPAGGNGYLGHDAGKGMFGIRQSGAAPGDGIISFNLSLGSDTKSNGLAYGTTGLTMNALNGTVPSAAVDPYETEGTPNVLPLPDLTVWHEFWITIQADATGGGTHKVNIYMDGSTTPAAFNVTSGTGNDYAAADFPGGPLSYIGMGVGATPQMGAVDVDFFAYKEGIVVPGGAGPTGKYDADADVDGNDFLVWQRTDNSAAGLAAIEANFGQIIPISAVPEPASALLVGLAALGLLSRRRGR